MCVSALLETNLDRLAAVTGVAALADLPYADLPRRLEHKGAAWVIRATAQGRLTAELMRFNPYVVQLPHIEGDMWSHSLVTSNHGLVVMNGFSDWVSAQLLLERGAITHFDIHSAYHRSMLPPWASQQNPASKLLLLNWLAPRPMLIPVLFDRSHKDFQGPTVADRLAEFVMIFDQPQPKLRAFGLSYRPVDLGLEAALEWLHLIDVQQTVSEDEQATEEERLEEAGLYFQGVLSEQQKEQPLSMSLYKSA